MAKLNIRSAEDGHYRFVATSDVAPSIKQSLMRVFPMAVLNGNTEILKDGSVSIEFELTNPIEIRVLNAQLKKMRSNILGLDKINNN